MRHSGALNGQFFYATGRESGRFCAQWTFFRAIGRGHVRMRERNCLHNNDLSVFGSELFRGDFA